MIQKFIQALFFLFTLSIHANTWTAGVKATVPLGIGVEAGYLFLNHLQVRGVANYFQFNHTVAYSHAPFYGEIRLLTAGLMGDYYPFKSVFRLTGGLLYNGNQLKLAVTPKKNVKIHGTTYPTAEIGTIHARFHYYPLAPYVGLGFDTNATSPGFSFTIDFGCIFQNDIKGTITSITGDLISNQQKEINDLNDYLVGFVNSNYWYLRTTPVLSLGFNWRW